MIQDIAPSVFRNEYQPQSPSAEDTVFVFRGKQVLVSVDNDGDVVFPKAGELTTDLQYLFRIDDQPYFLCLPEKYDSLSVTGAGPGSQVFSASTMTFSLLVTVTLPSLLSSEESVFSSVWI